MLEFSICTTESFTTGAKEVYLVILCTHHMTTMKSFLRVKVFEHTGQVKGFIVMTNYSERAIKCQKHSLLYGFILVVLLE